MTELTVLETWLPVPGYEGLYEVSDLGRIKSLKQPGPRRRNTDLIIPGVARSTGGHMVVTFYKNSRAAQRRIHQIVLETFVGACPDGLEVRHLNDVPSDNRLSNLAYGTRSENVLDRVRLGTHHNSSKTHCIHGHEFTPKNTYFRPNGIGRTCRICRARRAAPEKGSQGL